MEEAGAAAAAQNGHGLGFERIDHAVFNTHNLMEAVQYLSGALGEALMSHELRDWSYGRIGREAAGKCSLVAF